MTHFSKASKSAGAILLAWLACSQSVIAQTSPTQQEVPFNRVDANAQVGERGRYRVKVTKTPAVIPINEIHTWTVYVETADSRPLIGAKIEVGGGMPQHSHGLPTQPKVVLVLSAGVYLIDGFKFHMPGYWEVDFNIDAEGVKDKVKFRLQLQ